MTNNLKNIALLVFLLISLIVVCNIGYNYTSQDQIEEKIAMLERIVIRMDVNEDDFSFLDEVLQDKRIVLLGEQLHNDATTFNWKNQLNGIFFIDAITPLSE